MSLVHHSSFLFYSSYWHKDDPDRWKRALEKISDIESYPFMLVGVDENDHDPHDPETDFIKLIPELCRDLGVKRGLHLYLEGPGGPTGDDIDDDEFQRIQRNAESVGIDTNRDNWILEWNKTGWLAYFRKTSWPKAQELGAYSIEIDNLYRHLNAVEQDILYFLKLFQEEFYRSGQPKLLLKNCGVERLEPLESLIGSGVLKRECFAEFSIMEDSALDSGEDFSDVRKASDKIGIQTLESRDTEDYQVWGLYVVPPSSIRIAGDFRIPKRGSNENPFG